VDYITHPEGSLMGTPSWVLTTFFFHVPLGGRP
jgi:hypothetical protein